MSGWKASKKTDESPLYPKQTGSDSLLPIADSSVEEFAKVTTTNMTGTFLVNRAVSKAMQVQEPRTFQGRHGSRSIGRGAIVNLASGSSFVAVPGKVPYNTSKHAVVGITKTAGKFQASSTAH